MSIKSAFIQTHNENFFARVLAVFAEFCSQKVYKKYPFYLKLLEFFRLNLAYFYKAKFEFSKKNFDKALYLAGLYSQKNPKNVDALYLQVECFRNLGQKQKAFELLECCLKNSKRIKTFILLVKICEDLQDFKHFESLYLANKNNFANFSKHEAEIFSYLSGAASKAKLYDKAFTYAKASVFAFLEQEQKSLTNQFIMDSKKAKEALQDLKQNLEQNSIELFLISGTFLGLVRDRAFIKYDKDIDVGIWQKDFAEIKKLLSQSEIFFIENEFVNLLQIKHKNGVDIDIFAHYKETDFICHDDGHFLKWKNSPFELRHYEFLGQSYLAPKNYELYLNENYGPTWQSPKNSNSYNTFLDTPNMEITDEKEYILCLLELLKSKFALHNEKRILDTLALHKEENFVKEYLAFKKENGI